ncbi:hypothetical protein Tco_1037063 [Tanacetum coccineum]
MPALMVIEGEVLNDFPRFVGILIAEFAAGGAVNHALKMKGDMIIKKFGFKANDRYHDEGLFVKELSKESDSKIRIWVMDQAEDVQPFSMLNAEGE